MRAPYEDHRRTANAANFHEIINKKIKYIYLGDVIMSEVRHCNNIPVNEKEHKSNAPVQSKPRVIQPAVDIIETKEDYILHVDMPGLDPNKIGVNLDKDILSLEATAEIEGLPVRCYQRQFRVMRGLDPAKCRADYKAGVLTLKLAKPSSQVPHQIKISCE